MESKLFNKYQMAKYIADDIISSKMQYSSFEIKELEKMLKKCDLKDELVLLKLIQKGISENNSLLQTQRTKLKNLNFEKFKESANWFNGVDFNLINTVIEENSNITDSYDLYRIYNVKKG